MTTTTTTGAATTKTTASTTTMRSRRKIAIGRSCGCCYWTSLFFLTMLLLARSSSAAENREQKDKSTGGSSSYNSFGDDIYLDDQDNIEGSGRGEVRDDLEASGSGLGPDDEDGPDEDDYNHPNTIEPQNKPVEPKTPFTEDTIYNKNKDKGIDSINRPEGESDAVEPSEPEEESQGVPDDTRGVYIMNPKDENRASSFFAQPGVLAAVIGGAVVGLLCAILVVMFIVYRMRKKRRRFVRPR